MPEVNSRMAPSQVPMQPKNATERLTLEPAIEAIADRYSPAGPVYESPFKVGYARVHNEATNVTRATSGVGGRWMMYASLARDLVTQQKFFMLPLFSGTQTPILDAIEYLAKVNDRSAVPSMFRLYEANKRSVPPRSGSFGPADYLPPQVGGSAVRSLLLLLSPEDGAMFVRHELNHADVSHLSENTLQVLMDHAATHRLTDVSRNLLDGAKEALKRFDANQDDLFAGRSKSLRYEEHAKFIEMAAGALRLAGADAGVRDDALSLLAEEYNRPVHSTGDVILDDIAKGRQRNATTHLMSLLTHRLANEVEAHNALRTRLAINYPRFSHDFDQAMRVRQAWVESHKEG